MKKYFGIVKKQTESSIGLDIRKQERNKQIDEQCNNRTDEDWEIIDNYLCDVLALLASQYDGSSCEEGIFYLKNKKYIRLWAFACDGKLTDPLDKNGNPIYLKDGTKLIIGQKDLVRFCKQHKFKLKYYYWKYVATSYISNTYDYNIIDDFLIGPIKY